MIQSERTILVASDEDIWYISVGTAGIRPDLHWDSVSPEEHLSPSVHSHSWSGFLGSQSYCMAFDQMKILFFMYSQVSWTFLT